MKVVQINAVYEYASTGGICKEISEYLSCRNIENYTFYATGESEEKNVVRIGNSLDMNFHGLMSRVTGYQTKFSVIQTKKLLKKLDVIRPDIVHLHNLHSNYINLELLLSYLAKNDIATVVTLHDCWLFTGKCTHHTVVECDRWKTGCRNCPRWRRDNPSWFFDRSNQMWNKKKELFEKIPRLAVIGVSDWITNEAKESFLSTAKIVDKIYNWIDTETFFKKSEEEIKKVREKYNIGDKFVILSAAVGWSQSKGFDRLIELSKELDDDEVLVLVGKKLDSVDLPNNVISLGYISNPDELASVYSMAGCYISMSLEESFGLVVAEAMACGTPAIVYDSTALPELIESGCGYIAEPDETCKSIYNKILTIKNSTKDVYSKNCAESAKRRFDLEKNLPKYFDVYEKILKSEKKKKVLQINSAYPIGSTGTITKNLANVIEKNGMMAMVAYGLGDKSKQWKHFRISNKFIIKINIALSRLTGFHGCFSYITTARLLKWIDKNKPDIIHLQNIHGFYINVPMLFSYIKRNSIKTVWTMHDCWAITGHCAHFASVNCDKWKSGCGNCPGLKKYPIAYFDATKKNFKIKQKSFLGVGELRIVTPSKWLADTVRESFLSGYDIYTINNGIDLDIFKYTKSELKSELDIEGKLVVLGMANKWDNSNNREIVDAISKHLSDWGIIVVVGKGDKIQKNGNIITVPIIRNQKLLSEYYSMADVFVNLTLEDTFPTVNIEALACGTPVITYNTCGSPEIIDEGTGYVVNQLDAESLIAKVDLVRNNKRIYYSDNCRKRAEQLYSANDKFEEYIDLYNK